MRNMKQDKTWGGNIELQAMSLLFKINIAIHQLNSPRWEIVNFAGDRTIHLSYHDGDHYASGTRDLTLCGRIQRSSGRVVWDHRHHLTFFLV
jgi:hypothetical protein